MADVGRLDGRIDHQWRAGDAPGRRLRPGAGAGGVAGDLRVRERVRPAGDPLGPAEGETGEEEEEEEVGGFLSSSLARLP